MRPEFYSIGLPIGIPLGILIITLIVGIVLNWKGEGRTRQDLHRLEDRVEKRITGLEDRMEKRFDKIDATLIRIEERLGGIDILLARHDTDILMLKRKTGT